MNKYFYILLDIFPELVFVSSLTVAQVQAADRGLSSREDEPGSPGAHLKVWHLYVPQCFIFPFSASLPCTSGRIAPQENHAVSRLQMCAFSPLVGIRQCVDLLSQPRGEGCYQHLGGTGQGCC